MLWFFLHTQIPDKLYHNQILSYPNKPQINGKLIYPAFMWCLNLNFKKCTPCDWFCGLGSHMYIICIDLFNYTWSRLVSLWRFNFCRSQTTYVGAIDWKGTNISLTWFLFFSTGWTIHIAVNERHVWINALVINCSLQFDLNYIYDRPTIVVTLYCRCKTLINFNLDKCFLRFQVHRNILHAYCWD